MIHVLDLNFLGIDHAIAAFLIETSNGPVLIETGPYSTFDSLQSELKKLGYQTSDIKHVFLTHIHFDHAGAAWALAKTGANIYLHPFGAPHMEDPTKLYNSAKMIYGDEMERLWGIMEKIPAAQLITPIDNENVTIGDKTFKAIYTPGHAKHHIAWQLDDIIFTGDVAGVKIGNGPVVPPCPPPDINLEDWQESIQKLINSSANKMYLTHFGEITNKKDHLADLNEIVHDWAFWVKEKWEEGQDAAQITPAFKDYTADQLKSRGVNELGLKQYEAANPSWMSVAGLIRYWQKRQK